MLTTPRHDAAPVRVGMIGCGRIAHSVHLRTLTRLAGVRVTALAEPHDDRRAEAAALVPGVATLPGWAELIARDDVDAVVICLPHALHAPVAAAAFAAHKHVYLEKPLATSLDEAQPVLDAWQRSGRVGMIGFNYRFHPLYRALRQRVAAGEIGSVVAVSSTFATAPHAMPDWKRSRQSGGGVLLDLASHEVDLVCYVLGDEVVAVTAELTSRASDDDTATLLLRTGRGVQVRIFCSLAATEDAGMTVVGDKGRLALDRYRSVRLRHEGPHVPGLSQQAIATLANVTGLGYWWRRQRSPAHETSFPAALAHFVGAVRGEHPATPDLMDGYRSLTIVAAAQAAVREGRTIVPADVTHCESEETATP